METGRQPNPVSQLRENWNSLRRAQRLKEFRGLPAHQMAELFVRLDTGSQAKLLQALDINERGVWLRQLPSDDAVDLIQATAPEKRGDLLAVLDDPARNEIQALLAYRSDVAGGLMDPRFARLRPELRVDEAIAYLRKQAPIVQSLDCAYVLDDDQHLLGVVFLQDLFSADANKLVADIMHKDYAFATENMDQEAVARIMSMNSIQAVPVLDPERRLKGIITASDLVDVVNEEASEDMQKLGGMEALDAPYMEIPFFRMIQKRGGWLAILFLGEMLTATAMGYFEVQIERAVVLALFIPLVISTGGNSGSQATTLVIRAMALGEVRLRDWARVLGREISAGLVLGLFLGSIGLARILIWQAITPAYGEYYVLVALTIASSLVAIVLFGSVVGAMLPFILRLCGLDPPALRLHSSRPWSMSVGS